MKTRIGTSFGLALMLFMGVFVTMLALAATPVFGDHAGAGALADVLGESEPSDPGAAAKFTVRFTNGSVGDNTADLAGAVDSITIEFEDDIKVPSIIEPSTVTITTTRFSNDRPAITGAATGTVVANPLGVNVVFKGTPKDNPFITLDIPYGALHGYPRVPGNRGSVCRDR